MFPLLPFGTVFVSIRYCNHISSCHTCRSIFWFSVTQAHSISAHSLFSEFKCRLIWQFALFCALLFRSRSYHKCRLYVHAIKINVVLTATITDHEQFRSELLWPLIRFSESFMRFHWVHFVCKQCENHKLFLQRNVFKMMRPNVGPSLRESELNKSQYETETHICSSNRLNIVCWSREPAAK